MRMVTTPRSFGLVLALTLAVGLLGWSTDSEAAKKAKKKAAAPAPAATEAPASDAAACPAQG